MHWSAYEEEEWRETVIKSIIFNIELKRKQMLNENRLTAITRMPYQFANPVKNQINDLFANSVMATSVVVSCILLSGDQLLRVEKLTVSSAANLI